MPSLEQQTAIADILSRWDHSIKKTECLITAKQDRRKWLMRTLLMGRSRLPQFVHSHDHHETRVGDIPADWEYLQIGEIADQVSVKNGDGKTRPVLSCTKYERPVESLEYFGRQIFSKDLSRYKVVKRGQFAYATNHLDEGSIGYQDR